MDFLTVASKLIGFLGEKRYQMAKSFLLAVANRNSIIGRALKKKLIELGTRNGQVQLAVKLMPTEDDEGKAFLNSLGVNELSDINSILRAKLRDHLKNSIDPDKKTVAICLVGLGYTENLGRIPMLLRRKGYNVLGLIGSSPERVADLYRETCKRVKIDACICVGLIEGLPEDTNMIYFVHDIYDSPLTNMEKIYRLLPKCNFIVVPNEPALNRYKEKVLEGRKKFYNKGETSEVCFIRTGYPKLDSNIRYFREHNEQPTAIVYATTIIEDIEALVSLPKYGSQIIQSILSTIPDRTLIFRPHPGTLGTAEVSSIVKKYSRYPRFVFDNNASFYMGNYAKSALMITDMSGTAFTYAFTTLRPVVFFSHNEAEVQKRFGSYQYFKDRDKVGYVAENIDEMVEKIKLLLATGDKFSPRIREYRDSTIYNIGKSEDYFVDNIEYIIENKKHPDWEYI